MKKILIFGADGFVGRSMAKYLDKKMKYKVFKSVHNSHALLKEENVFVGDICDEKFVSQTIVELKPDYIINLCGVNSISKGEQDPKQTINSNVMGSINILEAIKTNLLSTKILLIGSSEEYDLSDVCLKEDDVLKPRNVYGLSKQWQEEIAIKYAHCYNLKVICVRAFNHTGIYQSSLAVIPSFCQQVAAIDKLGKRGIIKTGNLNVYRDISDVRDVVDAYMKLLESNISFGVYNVCSGKSFLLQNLLEEIISFSKCEIMIKIDSSRYRADDPLFIMGDNNKLIFDTAWKRKYDIKTTLRYIYNYYRTGGKEI